MLLRAVSACAVEVAWADRYVLSHHAQLSSEVKEANEVRRRNRELRDEMRRNARAAGASPSTMRRLGEPWGLARLLVAAATAALALILRTIAPPCSSIVDEGYIKCNE